MTQAIDDPLVPDTNPLQKRIEELEAVMRTVLEQIDAHQVYDKDARTLIRRTLANSRTRPLRAMRSTPEFPSMFPSAAASSQNFL
jgi:hypothetical protein